MNHTNAFLSFIADFCRDPMLEISDEGRILQANRSAQQLLDQVGAEGGGLSDLALFLEDETPLTGPHLKSISQKGESRSVVCRPLGTHQYLRFQLLAQGAENSASLLVVLRPDTRRVGEPEPYQLAEEKFYKAFHLSPDAISITRLSDGYFREVNEGFIRLTGYRREELIGTTISDIRLWDDPKKRAQLRAQLEKEGVCLQEAKFRLKSGELADGQIHARIINIHGEPSMISVVRDLREVRAAQLALRENEKRLQMITQATNDAIWDWELATNRLWWNDGITRIFGYIPDEITPDIYWWESNIHDEDRARVSDRINQFIQRKEDRWFDKYRFRRQDGSYAYVYDKGHIITNEQGEAVRMVGGMVDITYRVLAEERLMIRNRQIAEYSFFNSHRIRGPLSRLLGLIDVLQLDTITANERPAMLEKIKATAEEIDEMVKEVTKMFY